MVLGGGRPRFSKLPSHAAVHERMKRSQTGSEVDEHVEQQDGVGADVEDDPARAEVVVEERNGHRQDDEVGYE